MSSFRVADSYIPLPDRQLRVDDVPAPPAAAAEAAVCGRNEVIDVIRLVAAAGIVYIHAVRSPTLLDSRDFFRFAVPFYLFASLYYQGMSLRRHPKVTVWQQAAKRLKRLYLPFLAWSVIYLLARDAKRMALLHMGAVELTPGLLWKGTEYHLWFLPFLLGWSLVLALIERALRGRSAAWWGLAIAAAVMAGIAFGLTPMPARWDETFDNPTYAYVQYWRAMPPACWAMAFALFMIRRPIGGVSPMVGVAGLLLALISSAVQVGGIQLIPRACSGLGTILFALAPWRWHVIPVLARLGRYSYGIYLCHVLVGEIVRALAAKSHFDPSVGIDLVIFACSFIGSVTIVLLLEKSRWLRWLNG